MKKIFDKSEKKLDKIWKFVEDSCMFVFEN